MNFFKRSKQSLIKFNELEENVKQLTALITH